MIDHSLLHPTLTWEQLEEGCRLARQFSVASVCIKPYAVRKAAEWLQDSEVEVGTVVGFPQGGNTIAVKVAETVQACQQGATEIDLVVNLGCVLSRDWQYVRREINAVLSAARDYGAILKVIFENDFLPDDYFKINLCQICSELRVDFVKTSSGFGMVKGDDGRYGYQGATVADIRLMRQHCGAWVQIKAAGGVRTLDRLLEMRGLGVTRIGASATAAIIQEAMQRYGDAPAEGINAGDIEGY